MPVNVFEDSIDLHIDLLTEDGYTAESWPYPRLKKTGEAETRRFRTVILENEYLRLTFIPALGGRLWEMFDKRLHYSYFGDSQVRCQEFQPYTPQGSGCFDGFRIVERGRDRKGSLDFTDITVQSPDSDEDCGTVTVAAFGDHSFSISFSLTPNSALVRVEVTTQNRTLSLSPAMFCGFDTCLDEHAGVFPFGIVSGMDPSHHIWFTCERGTFVENLECLVETYYLKRFERDAVLAPRQADSYQFNIQPIQNLGGETFVGECGVGFLTPERFKFTANQPIVGCRLVIQNSVGACFETAFNAYPEATLDINLSSISGRVVAAKITDSHGVEIATMTTKPLQVVPGVNFGRQTSNRQFVGDISEDPVGDFRRAYPQIDVTTLEDYQLNRLTSDPILRVPAYLELAARATERGDFQRADTCYEYALLFNGDDPLAWWAKAVNRRIGNLGTEGEERTELLNAHFLSPLEPCLRAESFLSQPRNHGKDPSPLLEPLNDCPENFIEVACQLIQARFYEEAAYFIDEALRHQNLAMLHYLQAWLLTRKGGMEVEVAHRVQLAAKAQLPPMPYRDIEREILTALKEKRPLPESIQAWLEHRLP